MEYRKKVGKKEIPTLIEETKKSRFIKPTVIRLSDNLKFYGITKSRSGDPETSLALKIFKASGKQLIIQYHEIISPMTYDGASLIEFSTPYISVEIKGKNLEPILDYLAEHRIVWIKEPDSDWVDEKEKEVIIQNIEIKER